MNYLAHAWLSFNNPGILVGNMISDFVKGKKQYDYPDGIHKGILLHRAIDNFTDTHAVTQEMKLFFKPHYRLYAGAFCDVAYDHFLANDSGEFKAEGQLPAFAAATYKILEENFAVLPPAFQKMLPYMTAHDWLSNYKTKWGIEKSFEGLVRRSAFLTESATAFELFNAHYAEMKVLYHQFYPELKNFTVYQLQQLLVT
jgi:acyl carrier protein phosphodiesterase